MITNIKEAKTKEEVFLYLSDFLTKQIELCRRKSESEESFQSPSWSEFQANQLGAIRAFKKVLNLFPDQGVVNE